MEPMEQTSLLQHFPVTKRRQCGERTKRKDVEVESVPAELSPTFKEAKRQKLETTPVESSPTLTKFSAIEFDSPVKSCSVRLSPRSSTRRTLNFTIATCSPTKSAVDEKFQSSAHSNDGVSGKNFPLPYHYKVLEEKYRCTNVVLSMLEGRRELCTFRKLKVAVEEMMRKNFDMKDLSRMKYISADSIILRQEKIPGSNYQMTIQSNVKKWSAGTLLERQQCFRQNLIDHTFKHHRDFLANLSPPVTILDENVYRWHPSFPLDEVPDIPEATLPRPPVSESYNTARDLLDQTEKEISTRVQFALQKVAKETAQHHVSAAVSTNSLLKGVSPAIIQRIRKKEALKSVAEITRDPGTEEKLKMLSRLLEMSRIIRSLFITENKAAIPWSQLLQKVSDSHKSLLSTDQIESHINYLIQVVPGWCTIITLKSSQYLKLINKSLNYQKIELFIKKEQERLT